MGNISNKICREITTHILGSVTFFFRKTCRSGDSVEEYSRAGQATDGNMAHALSMLNT